LRKYSNFHLYLEQRIIYRWVDRLHVESLIILK